MSTTISSYPSFMLFHYQLFYSKTRPRSIATVLLSLNLNLFPLIFVSLQPQNVMFKSEGGSKIKLIDFSLTKKFDPDQETKISFGTAEYVGNLTSND